MPIPIDSGRNRAQRLMAMLQLCDSALPVGTFTFSGGLETAVASGRVRDMESLEAYVRTLLRQALYTDCIPALMAHRAAVRDDYEGVVVADRFLLATKSAAESRRMAQRMGQKLLQLCTRFLASPLLSRYAADVEAGRLPGCHAVGQAVVFAVVELDEKALFCAMRYGQLSMLLGAALRLMRVSHLETQQLLYRLGAEADGDYHAVVTLDYEDVHSFCPMVEVRAAQHELGSARLFMN